MNQLIRNVTRLCGLALAPESVGILARRKHLPGAQSSSSARVAASFTRSWSSALLLMRLCCVATLCGCTVPNDQEAAPTFRVMTYNMHHGEGLDKRVDLQRIADLIKHEGADIVALQEVDKGTERTARRDFPAEFARLTGLTCVFSNNYTYQGGEYGNAVLTRFPVVQATNTHYVKVNETEQRGILQLTLDRSEERRVGKECRSRWSPYH